MHARKRKSPWFRTAMGVAALLAVLDGDGVSLAAPGSFTVASSCPAVDQPMSSKLVGNLEARQTYPLLKTGGPGGNWCKLQLPQGPAWVRCAAGTINGLSATAQERNGAQQQSPAQRFTGTSNVPGEFDYYLLSISWSPAFCATHADRVQQCGIDTHFGFVIHGLWPQYD